MKRRFNLPVEWAVLCFCAWQAADLAIAWRHSPFDAVGWVALVIWLIPSLASRLWWCRGNALPRRRPLLAWLALGACLAGIVTDMHFLKHCSFALACAAITPAFPGFCLWFILALAWMPALGWLLGGVRPLGVVLVRVALALVAALTALIGLRCGLRKLPK